jgi:hypothetical protein
VNKEINSPNALMLAVSLTISGVYWQAVYPVPIPRLINPNSTNRIIYREILKA